MKQYNKQLGCFIELDTIDRQAAREGQALHTASQNRINRHNIIDKHKQRFIKSKWASRED